MSRGALCCYGNCGEYVVKVSVNVRGDVGIGERPKFCSAEHAALWLIKHAFRINGKGDAATKARLLKAVDDILEPR